jgi:hypothetical protein
LRLALVCAFLLASVSPLAHAWGADGHSVIAEIAQRRLTPQASRAVARILGTGVSLASVSSWADDVRDARPETYNWHFVDIPIAEQDPDPDKHCKPDPKGDCIVAELNRLRNELRCASNAEKKKDALRYAVHFVGDIHQPLHTVEDEKGGNFVQVTVNVRGVTCTRSCVATPTPARLHAVWDVVLIQKAVWNWGALVDLVERDLTASMAGATKSRQPRAWAIETYMVARDVWALTPADLVIDEQYYRAASPIVRQQLGRAGVRLAQFLNDAYSSQSCPVP